MLAVVDHRFGEVTRVGYSREHRPQIIIGSPWQVRSKKAFPGIAFSSDYSRWRSNGASVCRTPDHLTAADYLIFITGPGGPAIDADFLSIHKRNSRTEHKADFGMVVE